MAAKKGVVRVATWDMAIPSAFNALIGVVLFNTNSKPATHTSDYDILYEKKK